MKLLCVEYNEAGEVAYNVIGDNALLRNNDDFYIPAFASGVSCVPQLVVKVGRIGKCVAERFARRYYEEVGIGIRFYADNLVESLSTKGLPTTMAYAFDGAAAISELKKYDSPVAGIEYWLQLNGREVFRGKVNELSLTPEKLIAGMSEYYMLKIGDLIYCGNTFRQRGLKIGDHLQMSLNGKCLLDFYIK